MGFLVMRVSAVPANRAGPIRDITRLAYPEEVRPNGLQGIDVLVDDPAAAAAALEEGKAVRKRLRIRGPAPVHARRQLVFVGPPPFDADDAWDRIPTERWATGCVDWVQETFPHATIELAAAHWNRRSPHVAVMLVPGCEDGRVSWRHLCREASERVSGKSFGSDHRAQMSALQDSCWEACGRPFGLERGEIGSDRQRRRVDHSAAARRERDARALERAVEKREQELEKRTREIEKREQAVARAKTLATRLPRQLATEAADLVAEIRALGLPLPPGRRVPPA